MNARLIQNYQQVNEVLRWLLFPLILVGYYPIARVVAWLASPADHLFVGFMDDCLIAYFFYPIVAVAAPRAKRAFCWILYIPITMLWLPISILIALRIAANAGLIPAITPPEGEVTTRADWAELLRGVAWVVVGTLSFYHANELARDSFEGPALPSSGDSAGRVN